MGAEHDDALHRVLELADVARPVILDEDAHGLGRDLDLAAVLGVELGEEMIDEHRDLFAPLPKGWDPDLDDVQAVVQVFPELVRPHGGLEVAIGGGDEPHVGADDLLAADAGELAVLEHVQELGLEPQRHLPDLVEKERALIGAPQHYPPLLASARSPRPTSAGCLSLALASNPASTRADSA